MKKTLLLLIIINCQLSITNSFSQTCNLALHDGGKITTTTTNYTNPLATDPKFIKEKKQEKKDEMIAAFNAGVIAGTTAPTSTTPSTAGIAKATAGGTDKYRMNIKMGVYEFNYYLDCKNDTLYTFLNNTPVLVGFDKANPSGYRIEGPMVLPTHIKTGDTIPPYDDITFGFPTTTDTVAKKQVFDGMVASGGSSESYTFGTDSKTGEQGMGYRSTPNTKAVYHTIDVAVKKTLNFSNHIIHHVDAVVTGEEEFTISGKKYKAYIIESEGWNKTTITNDYETADAEVKKELYAADKKRQRAENKMAVKRQWTNKLGYTVGFMKEWYVPQIGIVKYEAYDLNGAIFMVSTVTGLE